MTRKRCLLTCVPALLFLLVTTINAQHFIPVDPTGESRPVIVQNATFDGQALAIGDEIAVFDDTLCVGASIFQGAFPVTIAAWLEVELPNSTVLPGAKIDSVIYYKVWQNTIDSTIFARPTYLVGDSTFNNPLIVVSFLAGLTGVEGEEEISLPSEYTLFQSYPNPFNSRATIQYQLPKRTHVKIQVFNVAGQLLKSLFDESQGPGAFTVFWNGQDSLGRDVPTGVYFYQIIAGDFTHTRKMLLLR